MQNELLNSSQIPAVTLLGIVISSRYIGMLLITLLLGVPYDLKIKDFHTRVYKTALALQGCALIAPWAHAPDWVTYTLYGAGAGSAATVCAYVTFFAKAAVPKARKRIGHSEVVK